ncbi:MAG: class I SAM-dependent methyltransferase [Sphingomonadaceae bacterium]
MSDTGDFDDRIKNQMNAPGIHDAWEDMYRSDANERFYDLAYAKFLKRLGHKRDARALDIGCGIGANTVRLVRHGYRVTAADYSEAILPRTQANMERHRIAERVTIQREDITALTLPDNAFDLTLCWGVLMHIPAIVPALDELARVTVPGGYVVLAEINSGSPEARAFRTLWQTIKRRKVTSKRAPEGVEHSMIFEGEALFWRHIDRPWLDKAMASRGFVPHGRMAGHLLESFHYFPEPVRGMLAALNRFYVSRIGWAGPAGTNILLYRKQAR